MAAAEMARAEAAAEAAAEAIAEEAAQDAVVVAAILPAVRPPLRPMRELAATQDDPTTTDPAVVLAEADVPGDAPAELAALPEADATVAEALAVAEAAEPTALADVAAGQATVPAETDVALIDMPVPAIDAPQDLPALALVAPPQPARGPSARSDGIVLASVRPDAVIPPAPETEVVTRLSTSGGQQWAVSIGRYSTRDAAERALLRAALAEFGTLDTAQRRVRQTGGAWEANFQGLSPDLAGLACRRLRARGIACEPQQPG
jgi:D-alanyl-D-alanine carboxypeptidase